MAVACACSYQAERIQTSLCAGENIHVSEALNDESAIGQPQHGQKTAAAAAAAAATEMLTVGLAMSQITATKTKKQTAQ